MSWLKEVIGTEKAIIAMCHMQAMPGDPGYDGQKGMDWVIKKMYDDLIALQNGGVDSVMFSNEFSLPYMTKVDTITVASMATAIGELKRYIKIPFGVNVLWDGEKTLDLAKACGADFVREIYSGVYASDFGMWNTDFGRVARHRKSIDAGNVKLIFNILPEDALCVSGLTAGSETNSQILKRVKDAVPDTVVLANTGCRPDTIEAQLSVADGAVVGTTFKVDGKFENGVDEKRVREFMSIVKKFRGQE